MIDATQVGWQVLVMDPDQTLSELFDAMADGDAELAREHAAHLKQWLARGGFAPLLQVLVGGDKEITLPPELASVICTSVIDYAQHRAESAKPSLPESFCEDPSPGLYSVKNIGKSYRRK